MTRQVSAASATLFRVGFGLVGFVLCARFLAHGWVDSLLIEPEFHFTYPGLGWVEPLPGVGMHIVVGMMSLAALAIMLGFRHRIAAVIFGVGLAYVELIDRTNYLNHYYWMVLTALVLATLPVDRMWSVDAHFDRTAGRSPLLSMWVVWVLRFQVGMVYFFAGIAKLNPDWLFRAEPLSTWLPARGDMALVGPLLTLPATAYVLSLLGVFFDLTVVAWLLIRRTRLVAYLALVGFHLSTWLLFPSIGVFPLLMSFGALVFFDPDWPLRWAKRPVRAEAGSPGTLHPAGVVLVSIYVLAMLVVPLRHFFIPGDVRWTGEGYQGSWQVMLTDKTGSVEFVATNEEGSWTVPTPDYLTNRQIAVMATDTGMIEQMARVIAEETDAVISARAEVAFNGRRRRPLTDPTVAITDQHVLRSDWVVAAP